MLRLRSDEQLVALFRAGHDEAFRVIHDRYRQRLFAYTRQMLPGSRQDAEDALQDVFVRAYAALRANDRELALRAWLYRVAHNRCIDELRRPLPPAPELIELVRAPVHDPIAEAEQRESLRRLIADVRRLPEQQRSALLMRELSGMTYSELAAALGASIPAVKSLLVRARIGLAQAAEARDIACADIRDELILAHDRRVRPNATSRRHLRDCAGCREFRAEMRNVSRQLAALVPVLGPAGLVANVLGFGGGSGGAAAGGGAAAAGTGGAFAASGLFATGVSHVATLLAAAIVTAGGAIEIQNTIVAPAKHHTARHHVRVSTPSFGSTIGNAAQSSLLAISAQSAESAQAAAARLASPTPAAAPARTAVASTAPGPGAAAPVVTRPPARRYRHVARPDPTAAAIADGALSAAAEAADGVNPPPADSSTSTQPSDANSGSSSSTASSSTTAPVGSADSGSTSTPAGGTSTSTPAGGGSTSGSTSSGTSSPTATGGSSVSSGPGADTGNGSPTSGH
jgi:RNA polymerase sigma factor (sigma-70 family)